MPGSTRERSRLTDRDSVRFLQWALPRLGYRWAGFRKVRRQVRKRLSRRLTELRLPDLDAYRARLELQPAEWRYLDDCLRITISRFHRDRRLWEVLGREILPELYSLALAGSRRVRVWSAGCGAGEEPFTLALYLRLGAVPPAGVEIEIVGTDLDRGQLERAKRGTYPPGCLRDLPAQWRRAAFHRLENGDYRLDDSLRERVAFLHQDIREQAPAGPFDLIFCRNLVFTYFDHELRTRCLERLLSVLARHGYLAVGSHESVPGTALRRRTPAMLYSTGDARPTEDAELHRGGDHVVIVDRLGP